MSEADAPLHRADSRSRALTEVERYYDEKTARIVEKYGPGPRIHFHTGLDARAVGRRAGLKEYRAAMVEAQESLVKDVTHDLHARRVLDVGCGLGGAALFLAARGATVTALTNVAQHVGLIRRFAEVAGVHADVRHGDAHRLEPLGRFDAAIAIESSCYFDRARWFGQLASVLDIGARVYVVDCFIGRPQAAARFDRYWLTRIGSRQEYDRSAEVRGFTVLHAYDLGERTLAFWDLSIAWNQAAARRCPGDAVRLERSTVEHEWLRRAVAHRDIQYFSVVYERTH